jgi:plasmid stabilization system protein ParE
MSKRAIVFSPRAQQRMEEIADYLYQQNLSNEFVLDYLSRFETWLDMLLGQFPESGTPMPEYGDDIRRVVYHKYSFVYRVKEDVIEILTVYRDNLP